jgi:dipeptidyl aminopeptidase/acylaminoacyl peptidase
MKFYIYLFLLIIFSACASKTSQTTEFVISELAEALTAEELAGKRLTPELLWKFGRLGDYSISADGKTVAYTVTRFNLEQDRSRTTIWSIPIDGGQAVCLTADVPASCSNPRWLPSGKLAYTTGTKDGTQIWEMNANGTGKRQVSFITGGLSGFEFNKNADVVMFTKRVSVGNNPREKHADLPKSSAGVYDDMMYRHWDYWNDNTVSHIWVGKMKNGELLSGIDIMEGEPYDAPLAPFFSMSEVAWCPTGKHIAYTSKKMEGKTYTTSTDSDIYLYNIENKTTKNITKGMLGYDKYPVFSPCGNMIAFQSMETPGYESDKGRLMVYNLSTENIDYITADYEHSASNFSWTSDSRHLYFISGVRATYQVYLADIATKEIKPITEGHHNYGNIKIANHVAGNILICSKTTLSMAAELFIVDAQTGSDRQLTTINENIYASIDMGKVEERIVKTSDGKDMLVWVVYPPDFDPNKKYPALLYCQGGPQSAVSQSFSYRWNKQLMAANGYIVVAPNRRGVPTFGHDWLIQISGDYGGQNISDYLSAIDDVKKENYVDEERLGAVGASYGGYSVYWLAGNHDNRFKAFISHCGFFNIESMYAATEEFFFVNFDFGGAFWEKPRPRNYDFSPHLHVDKWNTPILVIHGIKDYRVPYNEGLQAFNAAQLRGIPSRLLVFPDEGHWILKAQNAIVWQREFFEWLDMWLK